MNFSLAPCLCTGIHWQHLCTCCDNSEDCTFFKLCFKYNVHRQTQGFTRGRLREHSSGEKEWGKDTFIFWRKKYLKGKKLVESRRSFFNSFWFWSLPAFLRCNHCPEADAYPPSGIYFLFGTIFQVASKLPVRTMSGGGKELHNWKLPKSMSRVKYWLLLFLSLSY